MALCAIIWRWACHRDWTLKLLDCACVPSITSSVPGTCQQHTPPFGLHFEVVSDRRKRLLRSILFICARRSGLIWKAFECELTTVTPAKLMRLSPFLLMVSESTDMNMWIHPWLEPSPFFWPSSMYDESSLCQEGGGDEKTITTQAAVDSSVRLPRSYISRVKNQYGYRWWNLTREWRSDWTEASLATHPSSL